MSTALKVYSRDLSELERLERRCASAVEDAMEAVVELHESKEWQKAGFTSWTAYCESDRFPLSKARASMYLAAHATRERIRSYEGQTSELGVDQLYQLRQLKTKRAMVKIVKRIQRLDLSIAATKREIDRELGKKPRGPVLSEGGTAVREIHGMANQVTLWLEALQGMEATFWSDAERDDAGCVEYLAEQLSRLASFLRDE